MPADTEYVLQTRGARKSFSGVEVLHGVDLDLVPGRVHAVVGENGAGKSTLIKILSGVYRRDGGAILIDGQPVETLSPQIAQGLGIATIYQERNLIPYLSVGENLLLGDVPTGRFGIVRWNRLFEMAGQILSNLHLALDPHELVANLSVAEQQAVEIAKALYKKARIVIMDEPTASLTAAEIENLFRLICQLKQENVAVIYISHRLDEIFEIADEVTVLRDGLKVLHCPIDEIDKDALVRAMVGEELTQTELAGARAGDLLLEAQSISHPGRFEDVSLRLHRGTIIGLAGSVGSGRSDVLSALAGLEPVASGRIVFQGQELQGQHLADFIQQGICLVPSERDQAGLILSMSVAGNTTLANHKAVTRGPLIDLGRERALAEEYVRQLDIQARSVFQEVQYLSGGNRQKVMLSKWLCLGLEVFLLDEPTQGVDVGAREEIHRIMKRLLDEGKGIVMVTSDLDELMKMSHYIAVMSKGRIVAYLETQQTTREEVLSYALGQRSQSSLCEPLA
ncbi:MAG: sugar ABC transporter ATP-binding protein [Chloroflexi bacterium]|nr:sugar ABC transporter ATP-binding protein [Chloroflexota bacterium]